MQKIKSISRKGMSQSHKSHPGYEAIIIGGSAGAFKVIRGILSQLKPDFGMPIIVVVHRHRHSNTDFEKQLSRDCTLEVRQAEMHMAISGAQVYVAPPDYHLLLEENRTFSLSLEAPVNFARPSIDVTFESAAQVYGNRLIGIILTGANPDGSEGLYITKQRGGYTIVQSTESSESREMPRSAINRVSPHKIIDADSIGNFLNTFEIAI